MFLVARFGDEPVACGFIQRSTAAHAAADVTVVPTQRRREIATAMLAEASAHAAHLGKDRLQRTLNERLGYRPDPERSTVVIEGPLQRL